MPSFASTIIISNVLLFPGYFNPQDGDRIIINRSSEYNLKNILNIYEGLSGAVILLRMEQKLHEWEQKAVANAAFGTK